MRDLTKGSETSSIILFALPMLLGNVFQQFYNMVDSWVVGRFVGTGALAAVGTSFPVIFLMLALIMGVTMGTTVLVSQYYGAKDFDKVRKAVNTGYAFIFWAGIALTVAGVALAAPIMRLLGVPEEIMPEATAYLRIIFAGSLTTFGYNAVSAILRGLGDSKTPLYLLIAATLVNVVLDLVFVAVFHWGVAGAAWATVISQAISFLGSLAILDKRNPFVRVAPREVRVDRDIFRLTLRIGLPTGVQQTLVAAGMMVLTRVVNGFGAATMAGFAAASRLDSFAAMPAMNLSQALSTFVGQNLGAGKPERVRRGHLSAMAVGTGFSIFTSVLVMALGAPLVSIFSDDPGVIAVGARYLFIVGAFYVLFSTMFINNGVLRGAGDAMIPMINTILALWVVRVPLAILFSGPLGMGSDGIWWSIPAGWLVGAVFSTLYYRTGKWKDKALVRARPASEAELEAEGSV